MLFYYGDFVFPALCNICHFFDPAGDMRVPGFGRGVFLARMGRADFEGAAC